MKETRFKQTEIGLIPEDWEVTTLSKVCHIFGRIGFRGYTIADIVTPNNGAISISPTNIVNGKMDYSKCTYISWYKYEESPEIKIYNGDILIVKTGSTYGKSVLVKGLSQKATINPQIVVLKNISTDNIFLSYIFLTTLFLKQIDSVIVGGAIPTLSQHKLGQFLIPKLSIEEQKNIASALTSIDNLLLSLDKLIEKKKLIKQGAMQELLTGKKRLPGFAGEWIEKRLGEIGEIIKESINPQLYRNQSFSEYSMPAYDLNKQPEIKYGEEMFSNRTKIDGTVLLYNKLNVRQRRIWYIENCKQNSICSMEFLPYKVYRDYLKFFYYKLSIDSVVNFFVGISKGTSNSQKRISPNDFLDFKVKYPRELQEQKAIATVLSSIDKEIESLEDKKAKYEQIKQGMMQQLLTGKIRLIS